MNSFIYHGGTNEDRLHTIHAKLNEWNINQFDIINLITDGPSIGIKDVKDLIRQISKTPQFSAYTVCVIHQGNLMTLEAQNSLLKTLEEPPKHCLIIIEASSIDNFLPTIISRCQLISLQTKTDINPNPDLLNLINSLYLNSIGKKMNLLENAAKEWEDPTLYIYELFKAYHQLLLNKFGIGPLSESKNQSERSAKQIASDVQKLICVMQYLKATINPKIALDLLAFP
jgi:DNA polymerase III gamma/tau subunit